MSLASRRAFNASKDSRGAERGRGSRACSDRTCVPLKVLPAFDGELERKLEEALGESYRDSRSEQVVGVP